VEPELLAPNDKAVDIEALTEPTSFLSWLLGDFFGFDKSQFFITLMSELKQEAGRLVRVSSPTIEPLSFISRGDGGQTDPERTLGQWVAYAVPIVLRDLHEHGEVLSPKAIVF
jgi:hypothetical protein